MGALSLKVVLIPCFGPAKLAPPAKNRQKHGRRRLPLLGLAVLGRGRARRGGVQRRVRPLRRHRPQRVHTHLRPVRVLRGGGGLVQQARNGGVELGPNPFGASLASGCGGSGGQGGARHRHVVGEVRAAGGAFRSQRRKPSAGSLGAHRSSCLGDRVGGVGCVGERADNAPCLARFAQSRSATPLSSKSEPKGPSRPNPSQETMLSPVVGLFRGFSRLLAILARCGRGTV